MSTMTLPAEEIEWRDGREKVATRLLKATADKSYDADVDIDWPLDFEPGKFFISQKHVSLYGTPLWVPMSLEERFERSKHESARWSRAGGSFEMRFTAFLLRHSF